MAAPHVSGAVARYLQGKTITPTTPASALSWLKLNATCNAISYFAPLNRTGLYMTPNRLLAIDAPASKPCTPASVTATAGNGNVTVRWDPVAAENGSATLRYEVTLMPGSKTCTRIPTQSLSCVFSGLESYEAYTASVIAVNSVGDGVALSSTTRRPNAVTNLAATVIANSLDVSWTKGVGDQDGVTYTVTAAPGGATCTSTATNCSITGLTVGTAYTLTVVGVNMTGTGAGTSLIKTFTRAPLAVTELVIAAADNALDISWINGSGEVAGTKYTATTTPGDFTCTSTSSTCSITSLVNGTEYSVSVVGVNVYGTGLATTAKGTPDGAPDVPLTVKSVLSKRTITLSWPAVTTTANVTYVVSSQPGDLKCTTVLTTCEVAGFSYGVDYSFTISTRSATGLTSSAALSGSARPGFKVNRTTMKRGSSMLLRGFLTPLSTGKQTWSETGPCYIRGTRLVAPKKVTKCVVVLKVTRKGSYPAMSTRLVISVK